MFIARQPIFNDVLDVYGYELLYRGSIDTGKFDGSSATSSTATVLAATYEDGIEQMSGGKKIFINFDGEFIKKYNPELLSPEYLVIEILENTEIDDELISRIIELKKAGYKIALDDFVEDYESYPISKYANIIKYDLLLTSLDELEYIIKVPLSENKILLAEKVETEEDFIKAKAMGFKLFQGYFFSKPKVISKSISKKESKVQYARILNELKNEEPSYQIIAEIIEQDVNLSYRLMKSINARVGDDPIYSIKKALTYLGLNEIERWVSIIMIQDFGRDKSQELIRVSLLRSKFAENISKFCNHKNKKFESSMMGLFSTIDALLDQPMEEALADIPIPKAIKDVLISNKGDLECIYELMMSYETGNWDTVDKILKRMEIDEEKISESYINAIAWTNQIMKNL